MHFSQLAKAGPAALLLATPALAADRPPDGRWVVTEKDIRTSAQRAAICAKPEYWTDIRANTMTSGGSNTDAQVCVVEGWKTVNARTFDSIGSICEPEPMGDSDGGTRIVMLDAQTMDLNNSRHILCPPR